MSAIGAALFDCLRSVERSGDFCVGGLREIFMPTIEVAGVGRLAFPLLPGQVEQLIAGAEPAPYGRGTQTLIDRGVRRSWQIEAGKVQIRGRRWDETLATLVGDAAHGLGLDEPVAAEFYKLLVYDAGSFFVEHRDTEKIPGMFATLSLVLPSAHQGGEVVVRHLGREEVFDLHPEDPSEVGFVAFYADCVHEVRPVVDGHRVTVVYNLRLLDSRRPPEAADYRAEQRRGAELLRRWAGAANEPDKLVVALEHAYTPAELSFGALKGADAGVAAVLVAAAAEADCDLHLALASIEESGSAEYVNHYGRRRWIREDDDDDAEEFEAGEVFDSVLFVSEWRRPDGAPAALDELPFSEDELCPLGAFEDLTPDEQHFHEATGNEGASFERTYRRAALVLWPRARRLAVLNQAGPKATLPHLEGLAVRWEASGSEPGSPLWREADELSGHMLRTWPRSWRADEETDLGRMLDLQARLRNVARIDALLVELSAEGYYAGSDNAAIVRAAALLPRPRATDVLVSIVRRNAPAHLSGCGDLLRRCLEATNGPPGDPAQIGAALIELLPDDAAKPAAVDRWHRPASATPGFVVDLLMAASRIDAGAIEADLAARALAHLLAWPRTYPPDDVLIPAALAIARRSEADAWPVARQLRESCLRHLRERTAAPLSPPSDWARANSLTCRCGDCQSLGRFLPDGDEKQWRLKAVQDRRTHVEQSVRKARCDLDLTTEKRGSPHVLVATKNQASYDARAKQRRADLEHMDALSR